MWWNVMNSPKHSDIVNVMIPVMFEDIRYEQACESSLRQCTSTCISTKSKAVKYIAEIVEKVFVT